MLITLARFSCFTLCLASLTACMLLQQPQRSQDLATASYPHLQSMKNFVIKGRIAINKNRVAINKNRVAIHEKRVAINDQAQNWSGSFIWSQQQDDYQIQLFGPVGIGSVKLIGNAQQVSYLSGKTQRTAVSAEVLLMEEMGVYLPVSHLLYWIKGIPAPSGAAKLEHKANGLTHQIEQQGWRLTYDYFVNHQNLALPKKIKLGDGLLNIKIIIKRWAIK